MHSESYVWMGTVNPAAIMALGLLSLLLNFIPSFIAFSRLHPRRIAIFILNMLFGWTGIGWIILLVWSLERPRPVPFA